MKSPEPAKFSKLLWQIYNRPTQPTPWAYGGNLPWDEPGFSTRMLREHLSESHHAASRTKEGRETQMRWLTQKLHLQAGQHLLDATCGPGLYAIPWAAEGIQVTGVDFAPAAIDYAQELAQQHQVEAHTTFIQHDIRDWDYPTAAYDAAVLLYGQLAVMSTAEAQHVLNEIYKSLKKGGRLSLELLNPEHVDKSNSSWWFTDDSGLWGDAPFLVLGERQWYTEEQLSMERYHVLHLESGKSDEIVLCDQTYTADQMTHMLQIAGFSNITLYPAWDGIPLYDAAEWLVYVAQK